MANKDSGIVTIHGKEYQTVALRVKNFRENHADHRLITEVLHRDDECVVMKAMIFNAEGHILATGHAEEYRADGQINKTSALENAETSAIGRALASFGLGGTEFASADEVANAITNKPAPFQSVAADTWDKTDEPTKRRLQGIVDHARTHLDAGNTRQAVDLIEKENLDADLKVALWSRFDSKERSAMKAAQRKAA